MKQVYDAASPRDDALELITADPRCAADHSAQFYHDDNYLCTTAAAFLAEGLDRGQHILLLATAEHYEQINSLLAARGYQLQEQATWLDVFSVLRDRMD